MTDGSATQKKNVLVVMSTMGQFPEMYSIAIELKKSSIYNPIVYFNLGIYGGHPNVAQCLNNGIDVLDYGFGLVESQRTHTTAKPVAQIIQEQQLEIQIKNGPNLTLKHFIKYKMPAVFEMIKETVYYIHKNLHLLGFFYRVAVKLKRRKKEKAYFKLLNVKLMLFAEDSEDYFTPQLIKIGHDHQVKSVVFPYTFANQFEFLEDAFFNDRRVNRNLLNLITGKFFPKWTYDYKGKKLLKSFPSLILSAELFKISPPNPWVMSSGFADVIAVESQFMKDYYDKAGLPVSQMQETGYPSLDRLHEVVFNRAAYKKKLASRFGLDESKPWVVCAVPPSQWPRAGVGFDSYGQFLGEFIQFLKQFTAVEVLLKFHPRLDATELKRVCDQYGVKFFSDDTVELIGMSSMYIASASSTIRWALAVGIPTINYDMYNYGYGDFDSAKNYHTVVQFDDFKNIFQNLVKNLVEKDSSRSEDFQKNFALLDGQANARIMKLFKQLTDEKT